MFWQFPSDHIFKKSGCPRCGGVKKSNTQDFISKATLKHQENKYDYSRVNYINARIKIEIMCNDCKFAFMQAPRDHLSGYGCPNCSVENSRITTGEFIDRSKIIHNNIYDYSEAVYIDYKTKVKIKCNKCNNIYEQSPSVHLDGKGCPSCCANNISKKEIAWLDSLNIPLENRNVLISINGKNYKIDGLDPINNIAYEFNGDYWHGNPAIFSSDDINKNNKKTYGELYQKTIDKENVLINAGYKVLSIWESEWEKRT